jgi:beta-lactamase superfamily II metal-dependent hydrolase
MKIEVFPSGSGDCMLITSDDGKRLLADAGLPKAFDDFIASPLSRLRHRQEAIDVAYVSHIDRDHIGGVLRMLDHEVKWRVFEHMRSNPRFKQPKAPRPPEIREIWHNAFLEDIAKTKNVRLGPVLAASANALSALNAAGRCPEKAWLAASVQKLALSVGDAIEVNWRIGADQLHIPLNRDFDGGLMVARPDRPIELGSLAITVLGPTSEELEKLRKEWVNWLEKTQDGLARLRSQHKRDVEDLWSGLSPKDLARASQDLALALETDVTPPNLASLVLLVKENGRQVLLTGDAGDKTLLKYLRATKLMEGTQPLKVDVLKVPHHGAHNSFSNEFVNWVQAANYVFCGDGEHHNPEPKVVKGYLRAVKKRAEDGPIQFWFNWSSARATEHTKHWEEIEALFKRVPANVKCHFLGKDETNLTMTLA